MAFIGAEGTRFDPAFLAYRILDNSTTFSVGELVESLSTGYAKKATAATASLGVIIAFADSANGPIALSGVTRGTTAYGGSIESQTTAADNTTAGRIQAVVCFDPSVLWSAEVNGTLGTTAASNLPGVGINVDSANTNYGRVLESTATRTPATKTNFVSMGPDPSAPTRLLVHLSCSEVFSSAKG